MFFQRCRLLLKRIYNSFTMFNQDNIAAAQIAQIFGSELLKVQQSARTDGGSTPEIVKMDPKQFLIGQTQFTAARKAEEQRIIQALQREAEAAYPVEPPQPYKPQVEPGTLPPQLASSLPTTNGGGGEASPQLISPIPLQQTHVLERIAVSLERIANVVDKVEIKTKRKTVKRTKPKLKKPTLLNEITA